MSMLPYQIVSFTTGIYLLIDMLKCFIF